MKKLMFVAAACALAGVASASDICAGGVGPTPTVGQRVYDFKASLKMVDIKAGSATTKSTDCFGKTTTGKVYDYYRVKASRTFKGIILDCDTCLWEANGGVVTADQLATSVAPFYVASSKSKYQAVYEAQTYGATDALATGYQVGLLNFFGGVTFAKSKNAEMTAVFDFVEVEDSLGHERAYTIFAAGFGSRDSKAAFLKSVSGNCAGEVTTSFYCGFYGQAYEPCLETPFYAWVDNDNDGIAEQDTTVYAWQVARSPLYDAVSGTWSLKYNSSKSKVANLDVLMDKTFGKNWFMMTSGAVTTWPFSVTFN